MNRILVVDDEEILARTICRFLDKRGMPADYVLSARDALAYFKNQPVPVLTMIDYRIGREDGVELVKKIRQASPDAQIVMMTGHGDVHVAVDAMKAGARDFLIKPVPLEDIARLAGQVLAKAASPTSTTPVTTTGVAAIIGRSAAAVELRSAISRILEATSGLQEQLPSVLITGESGTGKDLIARALHQDGPRSSKPFVSINCASIPAELVESELFGHERGAFTDAKQSKPGLFEEADGGVLFLDEIGDMPMAVQAKLLRVLEQRTIRRVGGQSDKAVDVWVVSATNHHLANLVAKGGFRGDLMFRLQVLWIEARPLRERDADILLLAQEFLQQFSRRYKSAPLQFGASARARLIGHSWPGNVRELRNVIERATVLASGSVIEDEHLSLSAADEPPEYSLHGMEMVMLRQALKKANGNVTKAAAILGISRDTMRYRLEKFGLTSK